MIKKDSYTWKIYGLVVVVLCIVPAFLHAQEKDFFFCVCFCFFFIFFFIFFFLVFFFSLLFLTSLLFNYLLLFLFSFFFLVGIVMDGAKHIMGKG